MTFEYKILDIHETEGALVVEIEHEYGKQKIGFGLNSKYLGNDGQPKWKKELKRKMEKRFGTINKDKSLPKTKVFKEDIGKTLKL